ncbi:hypothetical protein V8E53_003066 [Lactarius tabidus]
MSSGEEERLSDPEILPLTEGFSITPSDASILKAYVKEFQNADTDTRKKILGMAIGELYALWPPESTFDKKEAMQKVRTWFYNHYDRPHRQLIRFTRRWSARNVFYHENKDKIGELTGQISGDVPGSQAYLGALQDATTRLWKERSREDQDSYAVRAKEWSDEKPPKHIQAKMANTAYRRRIIRDFQTQLFKTCGIRSIVLVAYEDETGTVRACLDEWNKVLDNGTAFTDFCPNWKDVNLWLAWMQYAVTCFSKDPEPSLFNRPKTNKTRIEIKIGADGRPAIPPVTLADTYHAKSLQTMLRDYCSIHIRAFLKYIPYMPSKIRESGYTSGRKQARIRWSRLCKNPPAWILEECYPEGFIWADPSKIRRAEVFRLLDHWRQREQDGLTALIWNPSCELLDGDVLFSRTTGIAKGLEVPSSSDSDSSSRQEESSSDNDSDDSDEEDFGAEIDNINDSDLECPSPHPDQPSPSPLPRHRVSRIPEEIVGLTEDSTPSFPDSASHSCKQINVLATFTFTNQLHSTPTGHADLSRFAHQVTFTFGGYYSG